MEIHFQVSEEVAAHLKEAGVQVKPYSAVAEDIKSVSVAGTKLWMDPAKVLTAPSITIDVITKTIFEILDQTSRSPNLWPP